MDNKTIEKAAQEYALKYFHNSTNEQLKLIKEDFIAGANWLASLPLPDNSTLKKLYYEAVGRGDLQNETYIVCIDAVWNWFTPHLSNPAEEVKELREENETLRLQLAGCGVAAMSNTESTVKDRIDKTNPYWSASYSDVCNAVDREMSLRNDAYKYRKMIDDIQAKDCEIIARLANEIAELKSKLSLQHVNSNLEEIEGLMVEFDNYDPNKTFTAQEVVNKLGECLSSLYDNLEKIKIPLANECETLFFCDGCKQQKKIKVTDGSLFYCNDCLPNPPKTN